jgi:nucleotide-binding universal stress UspA family protein
MIVEGIPFVEIVKIANDLDCDLVVMGMHRSQPGPTEVLFGSTAEKVLRAARRPVLCVP